jgi:folate-dependent phosphoribosylglycinamide formyltransferase PurN
VKWIAFFSQTGSEIVQLSQSLNKVPDLIATNNYETALKINPKLRMIGAPIQYGSHDMLMTFLREQTLWRPCDTIITLHGYLRLIPQDVCEMYEIYNGHPAAIDIYPELKGKDPQVRTWEGKYNTLGSVVHRVIPEVDAGEIYTKKHQKNLAKNLDEVYGTLKELSLQSWTQFMRMRTNAYWNNGVAVSR